jgi:hypothetical protein
LFLAAKFWRHAGRVGASYSDRYKEKTVFDRLVSRLRTMTASAGRFAPAIATACAADSLVHEKLCATAPA